AHDAAGNSADVKASHAYTVDLTAPVATLTIDTVAGDDIVNLEESKVQQTISGKVVGEFQTGDIVSFALNGTTYSTTVDKDGKWSVKVAGADLAAETNIHATLVAHDVAGNVGIIVADHGYEVKLDSSAPTIRDVVDNDDPAHLIDVPKDGSTNDTTPVISGDGAEKGDIIHVFDGDKELGSTTANDDGTWSFEVPADKALAEGEHDFTVKAEDAAGNISDPSQPYPIVIDTTPPVATLTINVVAGDDIVNAEEAKVQQTISGKATGEFQTGDLVKFDLNGTTYSAAVDKDGNWSVSVSGADLAKETNIHATLVAHDAAGNVADVVADHAYTVIDKPPVASLNINIVAGDDIVNLAESKTAQQITGGTTGGRAGDIVKIVVNDVTYSGKIDAAGKWSISVPGAELVADADHRIEASFVATDAAGNSASATATHDYSVDITAPVATLTINVVAGDDIVNIAESKSPQTISGKASGEFQTGDVVSFKLNGTTYSAAVDKDGNWSVSVSGADLA
ncbi:Ig-like domain-containing protein, partial [Pseudomonas sp. PDM22]|uniref:Ig-like domain-containing protein n=1 Tax=Pseudomonas sp. PDM22 TaxID=2769287 RepID=UPI00177D0631